MKKIGISIWVILFSLICAVHSLAQVSLVKDINTSEYTESSYISYLTEVNGSLYFTAYEFDDNGDFQPGLYKQDGAISVKLGDFYAYYLTELNGILYFIANGKLYKTDGTVVGTLPVTNISLSISSITTGGSMLYFTAWTGTYYSIWQSDGTGSGTIKIVDLANQYPQNLTYANGSLYFTYQYGSGSTYTSELWKSDGTTAGTNLLEIHRDIRGIASFDNKLYYSAYNNTTGWGLWKSDGTASGTAKIGSLYADSFITVDGILYFNGNNQLYKTDGTPAGTVPVSTNVSGIQDLSANGNKLFFKASSSTTGYELWSYDITVGGSSILVKDIIPGAESSSPYNLVNVGNSIFFSAQDVNGDIELWVSDGTSSGTKRANNINTKSIGSYPTFLTNLNGTLYFNATDGQNGFELWKSDGTVSGTAQVKDIYAGEWGSRPQFITAIGSEVYFGAYGDFNSHGLWKSDGTANGTVKVGSVYASYLTNVGGVLYFNSNHSRLYKLVGNTPTEVSTQYLQIYTEMSSIGNTLYFGAWDGVSHGLWKSDGTASGTIKVRNFDYFTDITSVNGTLYFGAYENNSGYGFWKSDGTASGTQKINNLYAREFTNIGGTVYFNGDYHLYKSDGTPAGTVPISTLFSNPEEITVIGKMLYFIGGSNDNRELWLSDGTAAGTKQVADIFPGSTSSFYRSPANTWFNRMHKIENVNGTLFIAVQSNSTGVELHKYLPEFSITSFSPASAPIGETLTILGSKFTEVTSVKFGDVVASQFTVLDDNTISVLIPDGAVTSKVKVYKDHQYAVSAPNFNLIPKPTITASGPLTLCKGGSVTLTSTNATSYKWSTNATTQSIVVNATGKYKVTVVVNGYTLTSDEVDVLVSEAPVASLESSDSDNVICKGESVTFTASGGSKYEFYVNNVSQGAASETNTFTTSSLTNGQTVSVKVFNESGCSITNSGINTTVNSLPILTVVPPDPICSPATLNLASTITSSVTDLSLTYWNDDPEVAGSQQLSSSTVNTSGTYWIKANKNSTCFAKASVNVTINSLGALAIAGSSGAPTTTVPLGTTSTTYQVANPETGVTYSWSVSYNAGGNDVEIKSATGTSIAVNWLTDAARVYKVNLTSSIAGCTSKEEELFVAVYDPSAGFVTGGGWITSPEGAYTPLEANGIYKPDYVSPEGKASFGFVSKYKKGSTTVEGNTEFQFADGNLLFKSTSYTAATLVVATCRATYKGEGTIEGSPFTYKFIVSVVDGQINGGNNIDKFRIKIVEKASGKLVYDNLLNADENFDLNVAPTTVLGGGSIVIHEPKKASSSKTIVSTVEPQKDTFYSYPTAFSTKTTIAFSLSKAEDYVLEVYDLKGALVKRLAAGAAEANKLYEVELDGAGMTEGVYITRLSTASNVRSLKTVLRR